MTDGAAPEGGWKKMGTRLKGRLASIAEEKKEVIRHTADTVEVWLAAGGMGYLHGRKGGMPKYLGIPADLLAAGVTKIMAFAMGRRRFAADLHSLGNGFGAYYIGGVAAEYGQQARKTAGELKGVPFSDADAASQSPPVAVRTITSGNPLGHGAPSYARASALY